MLAKCTQELEMEKNVGKLRKDCDCTKPCQETNLQLSVSSGQTGIKGSMTNLMFYSDYYNLLNQIENGNVSKTNFTGEYDATQTQSCIYCFVVNHPIHGFEARNIS